MEAGIPRTFLDAVHFFKNERTCIEFMAAIRWPNDVTCPTCGNEKVSFLANQFRWQCSKNTHKKRQFSVKVGTIFEDSPIGLDKWLPTVWLLVNCKTGISSYEVGRDLGVTQKTAWFMLQRVRLAMQTGSFEKAKGEVEADETFIGGLARNMHKDKKAKITGTGGAGKAVVMGILDRERGHVRVKHVQNTKRHTLQSEILANVESGSEVFTDSLASYTGLEGEYVHAFVDHTEHYVNGRIHTNGLENFWSLLKRGLKGTYISVEPFHLFCYLDEQTFRYNERRTTDAGRFVEALRNITGRRLTYKEHIGGGAPAFEPSSAPAE